MMSNIYILGTTTAFTMAYIETDERFKSVQEEVEENLETMK